ncbi:response regulator transcription factor [Pseudovibrio flavus]|uniref:response regulator transcription factor n=1 Tax=Pseudovibrio flavus TaxID=2529854 RepID=UPI0027B8D938|nr:response regulator transcription factor [Pseudovibrio flavus]
MLLVEDNDDLAETIVERFKSEGHAIDREALGEEACDLLRHKEFDLVVLDINLPDRSGFDVLRTIRQRNDATPVLILSARSEVDDRLIGLDAGADDYLTKPFDFRELSARCRVLARRQAGDATNQFKAGNFVFDRLAKTASIDGVDCALRNREVQLLEVFLGNLGRVLTKEDLADKIYTFEEVPSLNAVEQMVTRLRRKTDGSAFQIKTVRGLGYIAHVTE